MTTQSKLQILKEHEEDFEWYPTTDEIIEVIKQDITNTKRTSWDSETFDPKDFSILDIGAGDGRVLKAFKNIAENLLAIEKSKIHTSNYSDEIFTIGADFWQNSLLDKEADVIFSNPPYSEYENWTAKIIKEANAFRIYLVIPTRWRENKDIKLALESRRIKENKIFSLGEFDFLDADRKARAKVEIVKIELNRQHIDSRDDTRQTKSAFNTFFDEYIANNKNVIKESSYQRYEDNCETNFQDDFEEYKKQNNLVSGNYLEALVSMYNYKLDSLISSYKALCSIDDEIFDELQIDLNSIKKAFNQKMKRIKLLFWHELLNRYEPLTSRLTKASREKLFEIIRSRGASMDFNIENVYNTTIWAIKRTNLYLDEQIVDFYYQLTQPENIKMYKSNRHFVNDTWQYIHKSDKTYYSKNDFDKTKAFYLDYRIVMPYGYIKQDWNGNLDLSERAIDLLNDFLVIAKNLGLSPINCEFTHRSSRVYPGEKNTWSYANKPKLFLEYKCYKNGNIHLKLDQEFLGLLNVKVSQILKWCKSPKEAQSEIDDLDLNLAEKAFAADARFLLSSATKLLN